MHPPQHPPVYPTVSVDDLENITRLRTTIHVCELYTTTIVDVRTPHLVI
jgi:hypothetical protein